MKDEQAVIKEYLERIKSKNEKDFSFSGMILY